MEYRRSSTLMRIVAEMERGAADRAAADAKAAAARRSRSR